TRKSRCDELLGLATNLPYAEDEGACPERSAVLRRRRHTSPDEAAIHQPPQPTLMRGDSDSDNRSLEQTSASLLERYSSNRTDCKSDARGMPRPQPGNHESKN